jgi:xylulokinase
MYLLGIDLGSSSVKASVIDVKTGKGMVSAVHPKMEMEMIAEKTGWAEQDPEEWYKNLRKCVWEIINLSSVQADQIAAIGLSYQMHGLVLVDGDYQLLRPAIIWCDSRAVDIGRKAFEELGRERCLLNMLNSPGNFTASKLRWVKENEPQIYEKINKIMLPGDYIAFRLTGEINTTVSGLSEGIFYDFKNHTLASFLLDYYGIDPALIPSTVPTFSLQGKLTREAADDLGLKTGTKVTYRAGDQPNNAMSLNVLNPGEIAATAGTSGVVYGVSAEMRYDLKSRVNTFAHVNHSPENPRLGVLLCINGTGILNSWLNKNVGESEITYQEMNELGAEVPIGSDGLVVLPFGNGAERIFENANIHSQILNLDFNIHSNAHLFRAAQEGIVFSFIYGMEIMKQMGIQPAVIRAGKANMFLSSIFTEALSTLSGASIELYNTDGSQGAARAAGIGAGIYKDFKEAFNGLRVVDTYQPDQKLAGKYKAAYQNWLEHLLKFISK